MLQEGLQHTSQLTVDDTVTAIAMGSGNMPVLATPAMMALMENAAMLAVADHLPQGCTTVGGHIASSHLKPRRSRPAAATRCLARARTCALL